MRVETIHPRLPDIDSTERLADEAEVHFICTPFEALFVSQLLKEAAAK